MGLAFDTGNFIPLLGPEIAKTAWYMASEPHCTAPLRQELLDTAYHHNVLSSVLSDAKSHVTRAVYGWSGVE
jgi:glucose-6-phosphate dehydrogenase assembly protein OpcA